MTELRNEFVRRALTAIGVNQGRSHQPLRCDRRSILFHARRAVGHRCRAVEKAKAMISK